MQPHTRASAHPVSTPPERACCHVAGEMPHGGVAESRYRTTCTNYGRQGDWNCPNCQFHNFACRQACHKCQAPIPNPVPGPGGAAALGNLPDEEWASMDVAAKKMYLRKRKKSRLGGSSEPGAAVAVPEGPRVKGTVVGWRGDRGFGFIAPLDGGEDVFCHANDITDGDCLQQGSTVEYTLRWDERKEKYSAVDVVSRGVSNDVSNDAGGGRGGRSGGGESWRGDRARQSDSDWGASQGGGDDWQGGSRFEDDANTPRYRGEPQGACLHAHRARAEAHVSLQR